MSAFGAVVYREARIRASNLLFIFWDVCYPLGYLLVFGVGVSGALGFTAPGLQVDYNTFFLAGVLSMASFGIASNTAWSFFLDRDSGMYYEMRTYPIGRGAYLVAKVVFNVTVAVLQAAVTVLLAVLLLGVHVRYDLLPILTAAVVFGTAGWFFFYATFALWIRRNDAFNTVTSIFYFVFLFVSSMFYPLDALPEGLRLVGYANPVTWQTDVLRFATMGLGDGRVVAAEAAAFCVFAAASFAAALFVLERQE